MTISKLVAIYCDTDLCPRRGVPLNNAEEWDFTATQLLKGSGWKRLPGGKHMCQECRKAAQSWRQPNEIQE